MISPEKKKLILESCSRSQILKLLAAEVLVVDKGRFVLRIPQLSFTHRPTGMFNGSTIASAVDVASGYAAVSMFDNDARFTTVELKVNFLSPAMGDQLLVKARVLKSGKVLSVVQVDVYSVYAEEGTKETFAATSLVTLMRLKAK